MNTFFKASIFCLVLLAMTMFSQQVFAQTEIVTSDPALLDNAVLVSNVNIYNATVISQENNKVLIGFDLKNEGGTVNGNVVESGLKYGIKVIDGKTTNEKGVTFYGSVVDERVFSDVFSLNTGEKVHKEIVYTAPLSFKGEYYFQVYGVKEGGLPYALAYIQEPVVFEGSVDAFSVNMTDCVMVVGSEPQEYLLGSGVDVASSEQLSLKCTLEANGQLGNYTPQITIYKRALSGEMVSEVKLETRTLESKTTNDVHFAIPVPAEPQAYDAKLILLSGSDEEVDIVSNTVAGHFVVQGDSATIHDIQLDKDYYSAGQQAEVVLTISGEAGNFLGSRASQANLTTSVGDGGYWYKVAIVSGEVICGDSGDAKQFESNEYGAQVVPIAITVKCPNPTTNVTLSSKDGKTYDEKSFAVVTKSEIPAEVPQPVTPEGDMATTVLALVVLVILAVVGYFMLKRMKKTPQDTGTPPASNIVGLLAVIVVSSLFFGSSSTHAATYYIPAPDGWDTATGDWSIEQSTLLVLNNTQEYYKPTDEKISVNYSGTLRSCGNVALGLALWGEHLTREPYPGGGTLITMPDSVPVFTTGDILSSVRGTLATVDFDGGGLVFDLPMTTKNPGMDNFAPFTASMYSKHEGDGTGVCDAALECTNVCNKKCDRNESWLKQSTGYDENTCTCYDAPYGTLFPRDFSHPYGIATPVDFTLVTTPVAGCAGGASTNVSFGAVVGANTFEIDCGAGFVAGQTATCNLVASGNHTITARASYDSGPWLTKIATVVVPDCITTLSGMCGSLAGRVGDWNAVNTLYTKCESGTYRSISTDKEPKLGFYEWSCDGISPGTNASCWFEQRVTTNPLLKFTALPYSVERNDKIYLTWETQNASVCTATGGVAGDGWAGNKAVNGSQEIVMTSTGYPHYYLQCWNSAGVATPKVDRGITVLSATYATTNGISSLEAVKSTINFGESSTIVWTTVGDVTRCETGGGSWVAGIDLPINGSQVVTPSGAVSGYRLKCYNAAGTLRGDHTTTVIMENIPDGGLVATCPYTDTPDSIIINFNSGLSRDDLSVRTLTSAMTSFTQNAVIPTKTYDIETTSYDGYAGRHSTAPQGDERWHFVFQTAGGGTVTTISDDTTDIADGVDQNHRYDSYSGKALGANIAKVKVIHSSTNVAHSVVPVCMKLSPVGTAPTLTLKADPVEIDAALGNKATLTWVPTNADKCIATGGVGDGSDGWIGELSKTGGSLPVQPTTAKTMYYMECWNSAGQSTGPRSAMVEVKGGTTVPGLDFTASPPNITGAVGDDTSELKWTPTNVVSCEATGGDADGWPGARPIAAGSVYDVKPLVDTTYTLTCKDAGGVSVVKTAKVTVGSTPLGNPEVTLEINDVPYKVGNEIVWTASPVFGKGTPPYTFTWLDDFAGETGTTITGNREIIKKTFATPQTVNVRVRITDHVGKTHEASRSINVKSNIKPQ